MRKNKHQRPKRKFLAKVARVHAVVSSALFFFYVTLSLIYSPAFLFHDLQSKAHAAKEIYSEEFSYKITAVVLGPPVVPVVALKEICENETYSITLNWPPDGNAKSFNIYRNNALLIDWLTSHSYIDTRALNGETYTYIVEAVGEMSPGIARSAPMTIETMAVCARNPETVTVAITSFDNKNRSQFTQTPSASVTNPNFSGITNTPEAVISLQIPNVVSAQTFANSNGYWNWQIPTNLAPGTYTLTVTATNPRQAGKTAQTSLTFTILGTAPEQAVESTSSSTTSTTTKISEKKRQPILSAPQTTTNAAVAFSPKMENEEVLQGEKIKVSLTIDEISDEFKNKPGTFFYKLLDEKGNEVLAIEEDADSLEQFLINRQEITLPAYVQPGRYVLRFGVTTEGRTFSKDYRVAVKAKPFIKLGANIQLTYPEFISKIGTMSIFMLIFLVLWPFAFLWETHLYAQARKNISEYNLVGHGYLGEIPRRRKRTERRFFE